MTTATIDADDAETLLSLPTVSLRAGLKLDDLRRATRSNPAVSRLCVWAGTRRHIRARDIEQLKALMGSANGGRS